MKQEARFQSITDTLKNQINEITNKPYEATKVESIPTLPKYHEQIARIDRNVQSLQKQMEEHLKTNILTNPRIAIAHSEEANTVSKHPKLPNIPVTDADGQVEFSTVVKGARPSKHPPREVELFVWMDSNGNSGRLVQCTVQHTKYPILIAN